MSRGEGEMDSHFCKYFWVILLNSSFGLFLAEDHGYFFLFSFFLEKITPYPSWIEYFQREILKNFDPFWSG